MSSQGMILRPVEPDHSAELQRLRVQMNSMRLAIEQLTEERDTARREAKTLQYATDELRRQLGPLHSALSAVFGELDAVPSSHEGGNGHSAPDDKKTAVWKSWIQKFGPATMQARMITAVLEHGALTAAQLRVAMQCSTQGVYDTAARLSKLGLLEKNGNKYSLKEL